MGPSSLDVAGIDGCRGGWVVVTAGAATVTATLADALAALPADTVVALDMPIGLTDTFQPGGRPCDRAARAVLGRARAASVFSAPPRVALGCTTLAAAQALEVRITLQTLNILPKVAEVDAIMTPDLAQRVHEVHPELAFMAMNDGVPVAAPKRSAEGRVVRLGLLDQHDITVPPKPPGAAPDDLLDACALVWSARRIALGHHATVPADVERDARNLPMRISW